MANKYQSTVIRSAAFALSAVVFAGLLNLSSGYCRGWDIPVLAPKCLSSSYYASLVFEGLLLRTWYFVVQHGLIATGLGCTVGLLLICECDSGPLGQAVRVFKSTQTKLGFLLIPIVLLLLYVFIQFGFVWYLAFLTFGGLLTAVLVVAVAMYFLYVPGVPGQDE